MNMNSFSDSSFNTVEDAVEIVIPIILRIQIYIEPVVMEAPPPRENLIPKPDSSSKTTADSTVSSYSVEPTQTLFRKAVLAMLLSSASAIMVYFLARVALARVCPDLFCISLRSSKKESNILPKLLINQKRDRASVSQVNTNCMSASTTLTYS